MCGCASGLSVGGSDNKRGGCDFHQTKMERPERAERHWLVLLVAPLVDGECGWADGCPTDDVHPLLLEHPGLDPRASRWTRAMIRKRSWHRTHRKERSWNTLYNHRKMLPAAVPFCARDWR